MISLFESGDCRPYLINNTDTFVSKNSTGVTGRAAAPKLVNNQGLTRGVVNDEKKALTVTFAQGDADGNLFGNVERMLCGAA